MSPARAALLLVLVLGLGLVAGGCEEDQQEAEPSAAEPQAEQASQDEPEPAEPPDGASGEQASEQPHAEVIRITGQGGAGPGAALEPGEALEPGAELTTGPERGLVVDTRWEARIEIGPDTRAKLGDEAPMEVLVGRGRVRGHMPAGAGAGSRRPPLRLATPAVSVEIEGSGDVWTVVLPDASTWVAVLQGRALLQTGATTEQDRLRSWSLEAGQALRVLPGQAPGEPDEGPGRIEAAAERTEALRAEVEPGSEAAERERVKEATAAVDALREQVEAELERGAEIQKAHARAVRTDKKGAGVLQRDLVEHSRARYRLRRRLLAQWERLSARAVAEEEGAAAEAVAERHEAVLKLLGRDRPAEPTP